jgi:hypothetical protein
MVLRNSSRASLGDSSGAGVGREHGRGVRRLRRQEITSRPAASWRRLRHRYRGRQTAGLQTAPGTLLLRSSGVPGESTRVRMPSERGRGYCTVEV